MHITRVHCLCCSRASTAEMRTEQGVGAEGGGEGYQFRMKIWKQPRERVRGTYTGGRGGEGRGGERTLASVGPMKMRQFLQQSICTCSSRATKFVASVVRFVAACQIGENREEKEESNLCDVVTDVDVAILAVADVERLPIDRSRLLDQHLPHHSTCLVSPWAPPDAVFNGGGTTAVPTDLALLVHELEVLWVELLAREQ
eukprot:831831-Rhodomonas_salina.1